MKQSLLYIFPFGSVPFAHPQCRDTFKCSNHLKCITKIIETIKIDVRQETQYFNTPKKRKKKRKQHVSVQFLMVSVYSVTHCPGLRTENDLNLRRRKSSKENDKVSLRWASFCFFPYRPPGTAGINVQRPDTEKASTAATVSQTHDTSSSLGTHGTVPQKKNQSAHKYAECQMSTFLKCPCS